MTGHKIVEEDESGVIPMSEMKPCQWAVIVDASSDNKGEIGSVVMRSPSIGDFRVYDMTEFSQDEYWAPSNLIKVRPIPSGTRLTIEIT